MKNRHFKHTESHIYSRILDSGEHIFVKLAPDKSVEINFAENHRFSCGLALIDITERNKKSPPRETVLGDTAFRNIFLSAYMHNRSYFPSREYEKLPDEIAMEFIFGSYI